MYELKMEILSKVRIIVNSIILS